MIDFCEGVQLGPIDLAQPALLRGWRNDYRIWRTCRQNDVIGLRSHEAWLESTHQDPTIRMYTVVCSDVVGVCGLTSIDHINRRAEFSLYISPDNQGRGLATRALKTLVSHGFSNLGLNSIWGECFEGNEASRMFEKIGFKHEGSRREFYFRSGRFIDASLYSILASEWSKSAEFKKIQRSHIAEKPQVWEIP